MRFHPRLAVAVLILFLGAPAALRALDKEEKRWLESVKPIMLPNEEKTFKGLKEKADREEFQKIFWARRDPDLETPKNEFQVEYEKAVTEANAQFRVPGREGYETECGRAYILLGKPDQVKKDSSPTVSPGARNPETWTYRDRPGQTFQGGQAQISFDAECRAPSGVSEQLDHVVEDKIVKNPNIDYRFDKDGRLVKLVDLLPKPSPAQTLLKAPRQDFPVAAQTQFLKVQDGGTALVGLVRGETAGLGVEESGGKKTLKIVVCAQALNEEGRVAAFAEEKKTVPVAVDGSFMASFRMGLKPGKYTLRAGALDEKTGKGSLATIPMDVPSFSRDELSLASLVILQDVQEAASAPDPQDPFSAFYLGKSRFVPYFGQVFSKSDALSFFYQAYDLKVDESTGKASATATLSILKAGKGPVARAEQAYDTPVGGNVVGPVPLEKYEPGKYVVQLKVVDKVAKKEKVEEVSFEIKP